MTSPLPTGAFVEGFVGGGLVPVADVGDGSVTLGPDPKTEVYGPIAGTHDRAALVGGCDLVGLGLGITGLGGSTTYVLSGRFDIDAAGDPAVVPLPAPAWLLGAGLGLLGLTARRRRA